MPVKQETWVVVCDDTNNSADDIEQNKLNVDIWFRPLLIHVVLSD